MGLHLARGELINLVDAMRARVRRWESVGDAAPAMNNGIRAFAALPVRVEPLWKGRPLQHACDNRDGNKWKFLPYKLPCFMIKILSGVGITVLF